MDNQMDSFLTMKEVTELLGVTRHTVYRWQKAGKFPKPYYLGKASPRYSRSEVQEYIERAKGESVSH